MYIIFSIESKWGDEPQDYVIIESENKVKAIVNQLNKHLPKNTFNPYKYSYEFIPANDSSIDKIVETIELKNKELNNI